MKRTLCLCMLLFALFAVSQTARAQEFVYSVSHVQQFGDPSDPSSVMAGYSGTGMTYGIAAWYDAVHVSDLVRDGVIVDEQIWEGYPSVFNVTSAPLLAGSVYDQYTYSILRIVFPYVCGVWYDAFGFSLYGYLPYEGGNQWPPFPAICLGVQLIYLGYTVAEEVASQPGQTCPDECGACKRDRRNRIIACGAIATGCEISAYLIYQNDVDNCNLQPNCDPANPAFNEAQCNTCMNNAQNKLIAATTICGTAGTSCFLTLPNCVGKKKADCSPFCTN